MSPAQVRAARRIAVLGSSGAGKSTLARVLGERLDLPVVHLDQLHWLPGWVDREDGDTQARVDAAAETEAWVMDGSFLRFSKRRFERAHLLVWLDYPTRVCLRRAVRRIRTTHGKVRADMAPGCPERLDLGFLNWIATWNRTHRTRMLDLVHEAHQPVVWLRHPRQTDAWLAQLG